MCGSLRLNSARRRRKVVGGLLLVLVTLFGGAIRLRSAAEPLWVDELHTGWVVRDGLDRLVERAELGNQSPLYFLLPWGSTRLFGLTPTALRLPSLVAGLALIPLAGWFVGRSTRSLPAALLVAFLLAVDRDAVFYAAEARVYAVLQCLGVLQFAIFARRLDRDSRPLRAAWIGAGLALFYLHYTTALVTLAQGLFAAVDAARPESGSRRRRPALRRRLADLGLLALGVLPATTHLADVLERRSNWSDSLAPDSLSTLFPWTAQVIAPLAGLLLVAAVRALRRRSPVVRPDRTAALKALAVAIGLSVAVAVFATSTGVAQLQRYRYLIVPATLLPVAVGCAVARAPGRRLRLALAGALVLVVAPDSAPVVRLQFPDAADRREPWGEVVERLNAARASSPLPVLLCPGLVEDGALAADALEPPSAELREFCRFPLRSVYRWDGPDADLLPLATRRGPRLTPDALALLRARGGAWLAVRGGRSSGETIVRSLDGELRRHGMAGSWSPIEGDERVVTARYTVAP